MRVLDPNVLDIQVQWEQTPQLSSAAGSLLLQMDSLPGIKRGSVELVQTT